METGQAKDLILCVGNPTRGDDGVGWAVADALVSRLPPGVQLKRSGGETTSLIEMWGDKRRVELVDAVLSQYAPVGTIYRFDARAADLPREVFCCSTHGWGVAEAVALARVLERLPDQLIVYGVEVHDFRPGMPLSRAVAEAVPELVERILAEFTPPLHPGQKSLKPFPSIQL